MEVVVEEMEIDLRRYVKALIQKWWLVVGLAGVAAVVALAVSYILPPTYEANVYIATAKTKTDVQFSPEIDTLTEEEISAGGGMNQALIVRNARLAAFRALAVSPQIAQTVLPAFEDRLQEINRNLVDPARFLTHVEGTMSEGSDLIVITVSLSDPQLASDIANAWGQAYEELINQLYGGARLQDLEAVQHQTEQARQDYSNAQEELEIYLASNPIPSLKQQITILQTQIDSYQNTLVEAESLVDSQEMATRRQLLNEYYGDLITLQLLLDDARVLQQQLATGQSSPAGAFSDGLALVLLHDRAFSNEDSHITLEFQTALEGESITASDVESLIQALMSRKAETEAKIKELTATLLTPSENELPEGASDELTSRLQQLTTEIQTLEAKLEAEVAHKQDLERQRDLDWTTYTVLAKKEAEVMVATQSGGTEVRLASLSTPPVEPTGPRKLVNTAVAGALGLVGGVFGAFALEWWRRESDSEKQVNREGELASE
jgi:succinoglycan biosynthesis transport protein ExoP